MALAFPPLVVRETTRLCTEGCACRIEQYLLTGIVSTGKAAEGCRNSPDPDPPIHLLFCLGNKPMLQSAALAAASWQCQWCGHTNNTRNNKRCCFLCKVWRDGVAPLSSAGITITNEEAGRVTGDVPAQEVACPRIQGAQGHDNYVACCPNTIAITFPWPHIDKVVQPVGITVVRKPPNPVGSCHFVDKNNAPKILALSPCKGDCQTKRGEKKSPSRGLGGLVLHPPPSPLPPALQSKHSITPPPTLQCKGIYIGFFGLTLTFAAKLMQHTANQLQQWAKESNFGVSSFTRSLLLATRSICLSYQGVVLDWMCNPSKGFIFCTKSCVLMKIYKYMLWVITDYWVLYPMTNIALQGRGGVCLKTPSMPQV